MGRCELELVREEMVRSGAFEGDEREGSRARRWKRRGRSILWYFGWRRVEQEGCEVAFWRWRSEGGEQRGRRVDFRASLSSKSCFLFFHVKKVMLLRIENFFSAFVDAKNI